MTGAGEVLARRFSRRGVLGRAAVVGAALTVAPVDFVLRPGTAYASVCGPGADCSTGWTAMCCTINNGLNQCPPGSFAGGWWKADSAGLCGGQARYYIDCQGECTRCGCGGGNYCGEGCWNCTKHCASGTCDERRVCWNLFRYGQCNQQIGCSGPVLCRVISCNPPWQFENCTTDVATDNNTTDHNAPCLPQRWSAIQARYAALGGPRSPLGVSAGAEYAIGNALAQNFVNGRMYQTGSAVHYVVGPVLGTYLALGGPPSLGFPTSDDIADPGGHHSTFTRGYIQSSAAGTFLILSAVLPRWLALGGPRSPLGFPVRPAGAAGVGEPLQHFQHGYLVATAGRVFAVLAPFVAPFERLTAAVLGAPTSDAVAEPGAGFRQGFGRGYVLYASATTPALALSGAALTRYQQLGGGGSVLGYPTTEATAFGAGASVVRFQNGALYTGAAGTFELHGAIARAYNSLGARARPTLGLPTADQRIVGSGRGTRGSFEDGAISSSRRTGTHVLPDPIGAAWIDRGAEDGALGFPLTDVTGAAGGTQECRFEGGVLRYDPATGDVS